MSSTPPPSPLAPGFRLDRYELICPIAEGGMASVWIARQTGRHGFKKLVAVKTILPKHAADPRFQRMFLDEARIASRIEHVNVAQILDVGEQHDVTYLVLEYVDGDALSRLQRALGRNEARIPLGVALRIMADVWADCTRRTSCATMPASRSGSCTATCRRRTSSSARKAWPS